MSYIDSPSFLHLRQSKQAYAIAGKAYKAGNYSVSARAKALSKKLRCISAAEYRLWQQAKSIRIQTNQLTKRVNTVVSRKSNFRWNYYR